MRVPIGGIALLLLLPAGPGRTIEGAPGGRSLSFRERVEARRAIEGVLWAHRLWPEGNEGTKPTLDAWLRPGALEREIEDDLRKSDALARQWGRPITAAALQAELDRIARDTQAPGVLREILDALHGDAFLAAEVLARHALADRLVRSAYAWDGRIHGETAARAAKGLDRARNLAALERAGDAFAQTRIHRGPGGEDPHAPGAPVSVENLSNDEWRERIAGLGRTAGVNGTTDEIVRALPVGLPGLLQENEQEFTASAVRSASADQVLLDTAVWRKRPFDDWWAAERDRFPASPAVPAGEYSLVPLPRPPGAGPCPNDTWRSLKRVVPSARMEAATIWTGSEMIVWGGDSGGAALSTGGRYRPDIDAWTPMNTLNAPSPRRRMAAVWTGTELLVWGGDDGAASPTPLGGAVAHYDPVTDRWGTYAETGAPPTARTYPTAVWSGSEMILWGGVGTGPTLLQTGARYDPYYLTWTALPTAGAPTARYGHTATMFNNEMVVWGGTNGVSAFYGNGARYDPALNTWTAMATGGAPAARAWHTAVVLAGRLLIWGGQGSVNSAFGNGAFYVPNAWSPVISTGNPGARLNHTAVVVDNPLDPSNPSMVIFGGQSVNVSGQFSDRNDGGTYRNLEADWRPMNLSGGPGARHFHSAVASGADARMIVWGGANGTNALGDGRAYDPFAEAWSAVSNSGTPGPVPSPRTGHTLTWTGSELIVWGGSGSSGFATTHASYHPLIDAWTSIEQAGAPVSVEGHTANWTGTNILVWGGNTPAGYSNAGAAFDLSGWIPFDNAGAPSPRKGHTAVWGMNTLMVWGGLGVSDPLNDGGRYTFTTFVQQWAPPMAPSGLAGRSSHTAVWTGSRMIVFGGRGGPAFNDGASYDLIGNAWTPLATLGAPQPTFGHGAVWTGSEMLVYGGTGGTLLTLRYGGYHYDPALDTWQPMGYDPGSPPLLGAPDGASVTWTGSELIAWGGRDKYADLHADGGRYNPSFRAWTPMSTVGNPGARWLTPAAQAGPEMMVWGGTVDDSGGRYCAWCAELGAYEVAPDVRFSDNTNLVWTAHAGVDSYGLYRGTLGAGAPPYDHLCLFTNLTSPAASDAAVPPVGTAYYYLVAGENACSSTSLGKASNGTLRPNSGTCP